MAYQYTTIVFETGDKVTAIYDAKSQVTNDGKILTIPAGTLLTIEERAEDDFCVGDYYLWFEEVEGEYRQEQFRLHPSVHIREE